MSSIYVPVPAAVLEALGQVREHWDENAFALIAQEQNIGKVNPFIYSKLWEIFHMGKRFDCIEGTEIFKHCLCSSCNKTRCQCEFCQEELECANYDFPIPRAEDEYRERERIPEDFAAY